MTQAATITTANGMAKDVFGKLEDVLPESGLKFTSQVKFDSENKLGEKYSEVVWLTHEHGFTYNGTGGAKTTLEPSNVAQSEEATMIGSEIIFRTEIVYKLLKQTVDGGAKAFESYWKRALINAKKSFNKRLEIEMLHGGRSLGTVSAGTTPTATTSVLTLTDATFAPGHWVGMKNALVDAYNGATKLNTTGDITLTAIGIKTKSLSISGAAADITALLAVGTLGSGVELYLKGSKGNGVTGLIAIATMTTGSYLGISGASYPDVWNGTQVDVGSNALDWDRIQDGLEEAAGRGCETDLVMLVNNPAWNNLNSDLAALRAIDSSYSVKKTEIGTQEIVFHSVTGKLTLVPSNYIMYGEAVAYPDTRDSDMRRIGTSPVTFDPSGRDGAEGMFRHVENSNTIELRAWSDQGLWTSQVKDLVYWSGIVNA